MRTNRVCRALGLTLCVVLPALAAPTWADNTSMTQYIELPRTDMVNAGIGGIGAPGNAGGGVGTIPLSGVSGSVTLALLYWHGIDIESSPGFVGGNADYDEADIVFAGAPLTGTRVAGQGANNGWPFRGLTDPPNPLSAAVYRADVTEQVRLLGNGSYALSGLSDGDGHSTNGASLIVYFDDGNAFNDLHVRHYEGQQSNESGSWAFAFDVDYQGGTVDAVLHVADGQVSLADGTLDLRVAPGVPGESADARVRFTSPHFDGLPLFSGESVAGMGFGRSANGLRLWDIRRLPLVSGFGAAGAYRLLTNWSSGGEAAALLVAQIVQPADPFDSMLTPAPHDFGDVVRDTASASQRFVLRNLLPHPITISATPNTTRAAVYQVTAQTCSGQTLAPDATCTVDVVCVPDGVGQYPPAALRIAWTPPSNPATRTSYTPLDCYGVPAGPFSRLQMDPASHDFGEQAAGTSSAPQTFLARNTGLLALSILNVVTSDGAFTSRYNVSANGCAGRTLQPGENCAVEVVFNPALSDVVTTPGATLRIDYGASDDASDTATSVLSGTGVPLPNDRIFRHGFEA